MRTGLLLTTLPAAHMQARGKPGAPKSHIHAPLMNTVMGSGMYYPSARDALLWYKKYLKRIGFLAFYDVTDLDFVNQMFDVSLEASHQDVRFGAYIFEVVVWLLGFLNGLKGILNASAEERAFTFSIHKLGKERGRRRCSVLLVLAKRRRGRGGGSEEERCVCRSMHAPCPRSAPPTRHTHTHPTHTPGTRKKKEEDVWDPCASPVSLPIVVPTPEQQRRRRSKRSSGACLYQQFICPTVGTARPRSAPCRGFLRCRSCCCC
jgi:hypothetical protein